MPQWAAVAVAAASSHQQNRNQRSAARGSTNAQIQAQEMAVEAQERAVAQARREAIPLYEAQEANQRLGFQGALDIFGQSVPEQMRAFRQGNMQAQQTMSGGLNPQLQAILGGQIDTSALIPRMITPPPASMFQYQLPEFASIGDALAGSDYRRTIATNWTPRTGGMGGSQPVLTNQTGMGAVGTGAGSPPSFGSMAYTQFPFIYGR